VGEWQTLSRDPEDESDRAIPLIRLGWFILLFGDVALTRNGMTSDI
jgi:hypothetical protein